MWTSCLKMGKQILKSVKSDKSFKLITVTENIEIKNKIEGLKVGRNTESAFNKADLIIDFTIPKCTFQYF